jgi:hypothetical protein
MENKQIKCYCGHTIYCDCSPLEEPKQETLEESFSNYVNERYHFPIRDSYPDLESAKFGAKWQQERIPSIIEQYLETAFISEEKGYMNPIKWFEQFKKQ